MKFIDREDPMTLLHAFSSLTGLRTDPSQAPSDAPVPGGSSVHLILVGDGSLRPQVESYLADEKLTNVSLSGYVRYGSLPDFFAMADILVHTARREPWGVTVNEALVCGLPVIAADTVGSSTDLIENGVNGVVFPSGNAAALGALLRSIVQAPSILSSLKLRCSEPAGLESFTYAAARDNLRCALRLVSGEEA